MESIFSTTRIGDLVEPVKHPSDVVASLQKIVHTVDIENRFRVY